MTLIRTANGIEEMTCPLFLYKLLSVRTSDRLKMGPEDRIAVEFATRVRGLAMTGQLIGTFTHIPHEVGGGGGRLSQARYALAKLMGLVPGSGDYVFARRDASLWLEAKRPKLTKAVDGRSDAGGKLNPAQELFEQWCEREQVPYATFTSPSEGINLLRQHGFIRGDA